MRVDYDKDQLAYALANALKERDEARAEWGKASMDAAQLLSEKTKVMAECDEAREALSEIALYLSVGMGDETTTAQQYQQRILDGIKMLTEPIVDLWKQGEKERDEAREVLMKINEIFIDGEDTYLDFVKVGNIATDYLEGL